MPVCPFAGRIESFAAVRGDSGADAAHDGRVDADAGNYRLSFGQSGKLGEHRSACAFDGLGDGLLVDRVDDAHNDLRHTLRKHVLIELSGALRNQADADSEFATFG